MSDAVMPAEEAELLAGLRAGDPSAYERLVRDHLPRLLAVTGRILGNEADAQDAAQDAFLSAFKAIGAFDGASRVGTWLHRIAVNAALMKLRRRARRPEGSIDHLLPRYLDDGHQIDPPAPWQQGGDHQKGEEAEEPHGPQRSQVRNIVGEHGTGLTA